MFETPLVEDTIHPKEVGHLSLAFSCLLQANISKPSLQIPSELAMQSSHGSCWFSSVDWVHKKQSRVGHNVWLTPPPLKPTADLPTNVPRYPRVRKYENMPICQYDNMPICHTLLATGFDCLYQTKGCPMCWYLRSDGSHLNMLHIRSRQMFQLFYPLERFLCTYIFCMYAVHLFDAMWTKGYKCHKDADDFLCLANCLNIRFFQ